MKMKQNFSEIETKTQNYSNSKKQYQVLFLCWLAYTCAYFGRYSYTSNITNIIDSFNISHADAGLVTTFFFFAYGAGQIIHGLLCKHYNQKLVVCSALLISALINAVVFIGVEFAIIKYLWLVNGIVQSVLWPVLILIISQSLSAENKKKAVIVMSTTVAFGTFGIYLLSSLFSLIGNFRVTFLFATILMLCAFCCWFFIFNDDKFSITDTEQTEKSVKKPQSNKTFIFGIVILCCFAVVNNLIKDGLHTWVPSILKEQFGLGDGLSIFLSILLPLLGLFGSILAVTLYKLIKDYTNLSGLFFACSVLFLILVVGFIDTDKWLIILVCFGLLSLLMHSINNILTSIAPLSVNSKINAGLLAGILNGCCYIGSTISSYCLGYVADKYEWSGVFIVLLCACLLPTIFVVVKVIYSFIINNNKAKHQ